MTLAEMWEKWKEKLHATFPDIPPGQIEEFRQFYYAGAGDLVNEFAKNMVENDTDTTAGIIEECQEFYNQNRAMIQKINEKSTLQ